MRLTKYLMKLTIFTLKSEGYRPSRDAREHQINYQIRDEYLLPAVHRTLIGATLSEEVSQYIGNLAGAIR